MSQNPRRPTACPKVGKYGPKIQLLIEWSKRQGSGPAHQVSVRPDGSAVKMLIFIVPRVENQSCCVRTMVLLGETTGSLSPPPKAHQAREGYHRHSPPSGPPCLSPHG